MQPGRSRRLLGALFLLVTTASGCGDDAEQTPFTRPSDAGVDGAQGGAPGDAQSEATPKDASDSDTSAGGSAGAGGGAAGASGGAAGAGGAPPACSTRITYGSAWIHGPNHPDDFDLASGKVTWDGVCSFDGTSSYAVLSNGWKPFFSGRGSCVIGLDYDSCAGVPASCETRIGYGPAWKPAPNHPAHYDDLGEAVLWSGVCRNDGADSYATLSNGWKPYFSGNNACDLSFRYSQCGGLYANPVLDDGCADPGVVYDGKQYVMACTSGNATNAFALRASTDLVHWQWKGDIFPSASKPTWAKSDYWAPEIHRVGSTFVAYYTARHNDGVLSVGAATAPSALGPYTDIGHPLLHDANMGLIDANHYEDPQGKHYLIWKEDGNAVGKPTPIHGQELAPDGLSLVGTRKTLITNDLGWEGNLVEGPWLIDHGGKYFLFYSANSYASANYAIGVARADAPLGPYTKASQPILRSAGHWAGPGHGSVITTPKGETWHVYHSWIAGQIGGGPGRVPLIDRVFWDGGWPTMLAAPSFRSLPRP